MMPVIASVRKVEQILQICLLLVRAIALEDEARGVAENVIHGRIDLFPVERPAGEGKADAESRVPQLQRQITGTAK